ncbi:hypothetical protein LI328DRAFT_79888 [Trichoderma asperelloides]|nr:hypothetical protein LI328DRAFT_79888 [Trichoderma asperelloides]
MLDSRFSPEHSKCWVSLRLCSLIWHHRNIDTSDSPRPFIEPPEPYPASRPTEEPTQALIFPPVILSIKCLPRQRSLSPSLHIPIIRFFVSIGLQIRLAPHHWLAFLVGPRLPPPLPNLKGHALRATRRGVYHAS